MLSPAAEADIEAIWSYTFSAWSWPQADKYIDDIFDALNVIALNPNLGQKIEGIASGYRRFRIGHHLIFYVSGKDGVVHIIRVLHEKSDTSRHLREL